MTRRAQPPPRDAAIADAFFELQRSWHPNITRLETDVLGRLQVPEILLRYRSLKLWGRSFNEELAHRAATGCEDACSTIDAMVGELHRDIRPPEQRLSGRLLRGRRR